MLNSQDLLVLRASLTFWFEEMGPIRLQSNC